MAETRNFPSMDSRAGQVKMASGLNVLAAIWLFISAFTVPMINSLAWSNGIVGVVVALLAAVRVSGAYERPGLSWTNLVLGVWVIISPWIFNADPTDAAATNNIVTGLIIGALAIWSAMASTAEDRHHRTSSVNT